MQVGHVPLTILVTVAISGLFTAAFHLGPAPAIASAVLLALLLVAASLGPRRTPAGKAEAKTTGTRFTVARIALTCLLAGLAVIPAGDAPDPMRTSLAIGGLAAAGLEAADGWLARITGSASGFSERLGALTAVLLALALALLVWRLGIAGPWVVAAGILVFLEQAVRTRQPAAPAPQWRVWAQLAVRAALAGALVHLLPAAAATALAALAVLIAAGLVAFSLKDVFSAG
jgi:hypothetical protein